MQKLFNLLSIVGIMVISTLTFVFSNSVFDTIRLSSWGGTDVPIWFLGLVVCNIFYLLVVWAIYEEINPKYEQYKSIKIFLAFLEKALKANDISTREGIAYNRSFKFKNENISLGKVIIDEKNSKIFIYESFIYKEDNCVCKPDIRTFKFNQLTKCDILLEDKVINRDDITSNVYSREELFNNECILNLRVKNYDLSPVEIDLTSVKSVDTFLKIYDVLNEFAKKNKK